MSSNIPEYADIKSLDTFPKVLAYNARNWPKEVAMREKEFGMSASSAKTARNGSGPKLRPTHCAVCRLAFIRTACTKRSPI